MGNTAQLAQYKADQEYRLERTAYILYITLAAFAPVIWYSFKQLTWMEDIKHSIVQLYS